MTGLTLEIGIIFILEIIGVILLGINVKKIIKEKEDVNKELADLKKQSSALEQKIKDNNTFIESQNENLFNIKKVFEEREKEQSEIFKQNCQRNKKDYDEEYLSLMKEYVESFQVSAQEKQEELNVILEELRKAKNKHEAWLKEKIRVEQQKMELDKYKVSLPRAEISKKEISKIKDIIPYMTKPRSFYKLIWETYYRDTTSEMVKRVVGSNEKCGIYKITNLLNDKSYIGQSNKIGSRFKEHIKCGIGIDTPSTNKFYQAMMQDGVENFKFEILEECKKEELNEREKYWIDFYSTKDYGYNSTSGGA